jgi:hypothetical protein
MARDLKCKAEFLSKQQVSATHVNFACYVRGMGLEHPFVVSALRGNIDAEPRMSKPDYVNLVELNNQKLTRTHQTHKAPEGGLRGVTSLSAEADKPIISPVEPTNPDADTHTQAATEWGK